MDLVPWLEFFSLKPNDYESIDTYKSKLYIKCQSSINLLDIIRASAYKRVKRMRNPHIFEFIPAVWLSITTKLHKKQKPTNITSDP